MNILLADDIEGWLKFNKSYLEKFLNNKDLKFYTFPSASDAYDFAFTFNEKIDLVVTDLEMEYMYDEPAGAWLIENLKNTKSTKNARYIIISGSYDIKFVAEEKGADGYIRKATFRNYPETLQTLLNELFGVQNEIKG